MKIRNLIILLFLIFISSLLYIYIKAQNDQLTNQLINIQKKQIALRNHNHELIQQIDKLTINTKLQQQLNDYNMHVATKIIVMQKNKCKQNKNCIQI